MWTSRWCALRFPLRAKRLPHWAQPKGRSPVCVRVCTVSSEGVRKLFSQNWQGCSLTPVWRKRCLRWWEGYVKHFVQYGQVYGRPFPPLEAGLWLRAFVCRKVSSCVLDWGRRGSLFPKFVTRRVLFMEALPPLSSLGLHSDSPGGAWDWSCWAPLSAFWLEFWFSGSWSRNGKELSSSSLLVSSEPKPGLKQGASVPELLLAAPVQLVVSACRFSRLDTPPRVVSNPGNHSPGWARLGSGLGEQRPLWEMERNGAEAWSWRGLWSAPRLLWSQWDTAKKYGKKKTPTI